MTTVALSWSDYYGKTWAAEVQGADKKFGVKREFINATSSTSAGTGKSGTRTYRLWDDAAFQLCEQGKKRFIIIEGGEERDADMDEAVEFATQGPAPTDPMIAVREAATVRDAAERALTEAMSAARKSGSTYKALGEAAGLSPAAVSKRIAAASN